MVGSMEAQWAVWTAEERDLAMAASKVESWVAEKEIHSAAGLVGAMVTRTVAQKGSVKGVRLVDRSGLWKVPH